MLVTVWESRWLPDWLKKDTWSVIRYIIKDICDDWSSQSKVHWKLHIEIQKSHNNDKTSEVQHASVVTAKKRNAKKEVNAITSKRRSLSNDKHRWLSIKSVGWMPWHWEPMKDVISCEKLRGGANIHRSGDIWMGKPGWKNFSRI